MPGKVLEIRAEAGQSVSEGDTLLIMEAMKMELAIKAPMDGEVSKVAVGAEDVVEADTLLLEIRETTE
jgi:3-methylcrotonyl-CoA carboxylase alpha subunit